MERLGRREEPEDCPPNPISFQISLTSCFLVLIDLKPLQLKLDSQFYVTHSKNDDKKLLLNSARQLDMEFSTFDVVQKRKRITMFQVGKLWLFKCFFEDKEVFKALLDHYNKDLGCFEFKSMERETTPSS